jgi:hypothetical protein
LNVYFIMVKLKCTQSYLKGFISAILLLRNVCKWPSNHTFRNVECVIGTHNGRVV